MKLFSALVVFIISIPRNKQNWRFKVLDLCDMVLNMLSSLKDPEEYIFIGSWGMGLWSISGLQFTISGLQFHLNNRISVSANDIVYNSWSTW